MTRLQVALLTVLKHKLSFIIKIDNFDQLTAFDASGDITLVETDGSFSDGGAGLIDFTGQTIPAWGDLGWFSTALTRTSGLAIFARIDLSTWEPMGIGWHTAAAVPNLTTAEQSIFANSTDGQLSSETLANIFEGIALSTQFDIGIILRETGAWYFVDDGNGWLLAVVNDVGSTATLHATLSNFNGIGSIDTWRVTQLKNLLIPRPIVSDSFSLIPTVVDSGSNGLDATPTRVGFNGSEAHCDGQESFIDMFSAGFDTFFDGALGTEIVRARVSNVDVWTDGTTNELIDIGADINNRVVMNITADGNQFAWVVISGGTSKAVVKNGVSSIDFITFGQTRSELADRFRAYFDGTQEGIDQTSLGTYTGALATDRARIGSGGAGINKWNGDISDVIVANREASIAQMATLHTKLDAGTLTIADLNTIFGAGNYAYYKLNEQYITDGLAVPESGGSGLTRQGGTWSSAGNMRFNGAVGGAELLVDGDMEAVGVADWAVGNSATLTKETGTPHGGSQVLRIAYNGITNPNAIQGILTVGKYHRVNGFTRSDGVATPRVDAIDLLFQGTTSTSYQEFNVTFRAKVTLIKFRTQISEPAFTEFDDITVVEYAIADLLDLTNTSSSSQFIRANLTITDNTQGGVVVSYNSAKTAGIHVYGDRVSNDIVGEKWEAGVFVAEIFRQSFTYSADAILEVRWSDTDNDGTFDLVVFYNGDPIASTTVSDAGIVGGTFAGLFGLVESGFVELENTWTADNGTLYNPVMIGA